MSYICCFECQVVFHKMSPNETLFLESTNKIHKDDISGSSFVNFHIWDFPGQVDFFDPTFDYEMIFRGTGALIFVIDAQVSRNQQNIVCLVVLLFLVFTCFVFLRQVHVVKYYISNI